jgi:hypothetical protein
VNQILLSLGGVIQKPGTDFTVSGSTLTFTTAPAANTSFFAILLGSDNGGTVTPTDNSVTDSKIPSSGAFTIGAAGTSSSIAGLPIYVDSSNGSVYTHDVSGTDDTAQNNTAFGLNAADAITTADSVTVFGKDAGGAVTTGSSTTCFGKEAGKSITTATNNICIGVVAGSSLTTGGNNIAIGAEALDAEDTGTQSVAIGRKALTNQNFDSDVNNVCIGHEAGEAITTGRWNHFIGTQAGDDFDTEHSNMGIGYRALGGAIAGGEYNVAIGNSSLDATTSGDNNVGVGYYALSANTSGYDNIAIGYQAALNHTQGQGLTVVGHDACPTNVTGGSIICIGKDTDVSNSNASYQFVIGVNVTGDGNSTTTIGYDTTEISTSHGSASWAAVSDQRYKKDIEDSTAGLSFIDDLRPVTFKFKQKNELDTDLYGYDANSTDTDGYTDEIAHGFIAQEIKAVIDNHPEIKAGQEIWKEGPEEKGKRQNVSHTGMIPMMVKAIQELSAKVKALEEA